MTTAVRVRCKSSAESALAHLLAASKFSSDRMSCFNCPPNDSMPQINDLSWPECKCRKSTIRHCSKRGVQCRKHQTFETGREYDEKSFEVFAVGGSGRGCVYWVGGVARRSPFMLANCHQFPSAEYDHNDCAERSRRNVRHPGRPINYRIAAILPSGRVHDPNRRLARQFRSVESGVRVEPEVPAGWLRRVLWFGQLHQHGRAASKRLCRSSNR